MRNLVTMIFSAAVLAACGSTVPRSSTADRPAPTTTAAPSLSPQARQCLTELGNSGSRYASLPDQYFGNGCSTRNAVRLSAIRGDNSDFGLSNLGPVACPLAQTFTAWARYGVDRAARQILGSGLERIETMGSYSCRNIAGTSRRSSHSRAEAIDVGAFILKDGRRISVQGDWNAGDPKEREFLRVVHRSACKRFGTVLGPDYNRAHEDHFHLEHGDGRFCR